MSRVGRKVIVIPEGVKITVAGRVIKVTGPLGTLEGLLPEGVTLEIEGQTISVNEPELTRANRGFRGLVRALVANMVHGVVKGYEKQLEISGVGYKAELKGETLVFALGYTHPIVLKLPLGIKATVDKAQTGSYP
jgi:large subunit ribosomal protein L6